MIVDVLIAPIVADRDRQIRLQEQPIIIAITDDVQLEPLSCETRVIFERFFCCARRKLTMRVCRRYYYDLF